MVRPDWGAMERPTNPPGIYLARVGKCREAVSKGGDAMLVLEWETDILGKPAGPLCWDFLMMEGKGASMGCAKLLKLGFPKGAEVKPEDVQGRRAYVRVGLQEYNGKQGLKVLTTFDPFECGYWSESENPEGVASATAPIDDEDIPF